MADERGAKIVSKYFGGSRSFAFDSTGKFVVVVGNAWLLEKGAMRLPITNQEIYLAIVAFLSSAIADRLLHYVSIQVSGGQLDLSKKYLKDLRIPDLSKMEPAHLHELVQTGVRISEGRIDSWTEVDELVSFTLLGEL